MTAPVRYRFGAFVLSPRQRLLSRDGAAIALIPKYFDLLLLLVVRRQEAVSKQLIFEHVWTDVVVSDGALAQAVRTLRRTLGDDSREPRYIRTVSRHGYQFVWPEVVEEDDTGEAAPKRPLIQSREGGPDQPHQPDQPNMDVLVDRLLTAAAQGDSSDARDAAERLHALGTDEAIARVRTRPHHAAAIAALRDARWNVAGAGDVPLLADREALASVFALVRLRIADVRTTIAARWATAAASGALGGGVAGAIGGGLLTMLPTSNARPESAIALAAIGALAGSVGAGGVAAGLATAEALARSRRGLALIACGAIAGAIVAGLADVVLRSLLDALFGVRLYAAGLGYGTAALDGLVMGGAAGAGYATATSQPPGGGIVAPHGLRRLRTVAVVGLSCAIAAMLLALAGRVLVGGLVHELARQSPNTQLLLAPIGRLIGEPDFGRLTRTLVSAFEGGMFGCALAWGFTRRPKSPKTSEITP